MLPSLFVAFAFLVSLWLVLRWFVATPPAQVLRTLKWAGGVVLVAGGGLLLATGRLSWMFALLAGALPWLARAMAARHLTRHFSDLWTKVTGGRATAGRASEVRSRFLHMVLDHDSGRLDGGVLEGPLRGRGLGSLGEGELLGLWRDCQADPQSLQLLEAWLDRCRPDWRERMAGGGDGGGGGRTAGGEPPEPGGMSRAEAYEILGLRPGASDQQVRESWKRLIARLHPDKGGSTYLAAKINQAKDLLLGP